MYLALYETEGPIIEGGINHADVHIKNLKAILDELTREKADFYTRDYAGPRGKSLSVYLKDPNGYEWELSEYFGGCQID